MGNAGKSILVTGAASGIGRACVDLLLEQSAKVCAADIAPLALAAHTNLITRQFDVCDARACREAVAAMVAQFGRIDGLIHMAAIHSTKTWAEADADEFNHVLQVNVTGAFLVAKAAAEAMQPGSAIVLTSSGSINVSGVGGHGRGGPAYVASKAAIIGLARALARSLSPRRIRVNTVSPGATRTAMTADYSHEALRLVGERTLTGKIGEPREIAEVAAFLLSDAASFVDGEVVAVNGGGSFGL